MPTNRPVRQSPTALRGPVRPFQLAFQHIPRRCAEEFFVGSYSNDAFQSLLLRVDFPGDLCR